MKLNYKLLSEEEGKGTLVILHGLLGSLDNWMTLGKRFATLGLKVFLVDQRNHGKSPHDDKFNYDVMADDLAVFLKEHKIHDPIILGHSMGGKTVMSFAKKYPDIPKKLIIADISPRYYEPHHQQILKGLESIDLKMIKSRGEADKTLSNYVSGFGERQFLLKNLDRSSDGFRWKCNLPVIKDKIENVGVSQFEENSVDVPTLFIRGDQSAYIQKEDVELIQQMFSDVQILTIANAGHWLHAEQPDEFFQIVKDFALA